MVHCFQAYFYQCQSLKSIFFYITTILILYYDIEYVTFCWILVLTLMIDDVHDHRLE